MASSCGGAPVLLGVCDSFCPDLQLSPYDNKIGGYPTSPLHCMHCTLQDFFPGPCALDAPPSCRCCQSPLFLLVQVYSPLEESPYHRLFHVFCCVQSGCWNKNESWLVLRSQLKDSSYDGVSGSKQSSFKDHLEQTNHCHGVAEWCEEAEDWGSDLEDTSTHEHLDSNCIEKKAGTNASSTTDSHPTVAAYDVKHQLEDDLELQKEDITTTSITERMDSLSIAMVRPQYQGPYFPPSYINVTEEPSEDLGTLSKVEELLKKYRQENKEMEISGEGVRGRKGGRSQGTSSSGEKYEKSLAKHGDRVFQKFHKQLSKCPEQILRYSWNGSPLLISDNPPPKVVKCKNCGSTCVFELQLMPSLVYVIQKGLAMGGKISSGPDPPPSPTGLKHGSNTKDDIVKPLSVEFGTVLVYTCSSSCWEDGVAGFREECVFVQPDPDEKLVCEFLHVHQ